MIAFAEAIDLIHIDQAGDYLFSPALKGEEDTLTWIDNNPHAVEAVIAERYTSAGLLVTFPKVIERILQKSETLSIDLETTNLTRYSPALKITAKSHIAGKPLNAYLARYPDATINTRPRMRVLAVQVPEGPGAGNYVWDLDRMTSEDRARLLFAVVDKKVLVGHNVIGFDLFWLLHETEACPSFVLDTLLLVRQCKPEILTYLNYDAAKGSEERSEVAKDMLQGRMEARASLEYIAVSLGLPPLDKTFQKPANWCVSELSPEHLNYVLGDIDTPIRILKHIFGTLDAKTICTTIQEQYPWYLNYHNAALRMTKTKGVPYSDSGAAELIAQFTAELKEVAATFVKWPEFKPEVIANLADPKKGTVSEVLAKAMEAHAAANKVELPKTKNGNVSLSKGEIRYADLTKKLPCWAAYEKVGELKKALSIIEKYREYASTDGRIHSMVSFITAAGRASSSEPNLQAMPRNSKLRGLVEATPGHELVWADYSAIELRIAAVNAERAIRRARRTLKDGYELDWFHSLCQAGGKRDTILPHPPHEVPANHPGDPEEWPLARTNQTVIHFASEVLGKKEQSLARVFRLGLDPHLVTGLEMARRNGEVEIEGDIITCLQGKSKEELKELKERFNDYRQQAKAVNFGLTYGMQAEKLHRYGITDYKLSWTLEEAEAARNAWFNLYPEVGFWQLYTKYAYSRKLRQDEVLLWNKYSKEFGQSKFGARIFTPTSLINRPFHILDAFTDACAYQGQGSGADILAIAISSLPDHLLETLLLPVHDELVLEVPEDQVAQYEADLEKVMIAAAEKVLRGIVPVEVETKSAKRWAK